MIHRRKGRKLKRTATHRKALLSNLSVSLIKHKKLKTTLAKAKELRLFIEPIITKSRRALSSDKPEFGVHLRREVNKFLQDKGAITTLFNEIAPKVANRNGGYTRVLKMGRRLGDGAELALIELVDYNTEQAPDKTETADKETKGKPKAKTTKSAAKTTKTTKTKKTAATAETKKPTKTKKKKEAAE
ncbi:MAG: 50S ribosomal protein L17 [Ignavibacteria bacterium]|nr:50S ribosomal protein L17 [Ignavibacteria bacterium]